MSTAKINKIVCLINSKIIYIYFDKLLLSGSKSY